MDRYDPNEWTRSFVAENQAFCLEQLRSTNNRVIELLQNGDYAPAVAGLDRILNGLITMLNAGGDYRSQICLFSWIEADILLFGVDAPEEKRRQNALQILEDAKDFAKSETTKQNISSMISDVRSGRSIQSLRQDYGSDFPTEEIGLLRDLNSKLVMTTQSSSSSSSSNYSSSSDSSSGCGGCFGKLIILAIIIAALYFVAVNVFKVDLNSLKESTPTPIQTESSIDIDTYDLDC